MSQQRDSPPLELAEVEEKISDASLVGRGQVARGHFLWRTAKGQWIPLRHMNTAHLFNAMKMCFNHLAVEHGGEPVWHEHVYSNFVYAAETVPHQLAFIVVKMLEELDTRTNLPEEMVQPLALIRNQVENARLEA